MPLDESVLRSDTLDYLARFCIMAPRDVLVYRAVFESLDDDRDNLVTGEQLLGGIEIVTGQSITNKQSAYLLCLLDLTAPVEKVWLTMMMISYNDVDSIDCVCRIYAQPRTCRQWRRTTKCREFWPACDHHQLC